MVNLFGAAELEYVEDDGSFLLDIGHQLHFMKAAFPVYIEEAFNHNPSPRHLALSVIDIAAGVLSKLEVRTDLQNHTCMESFAELVAVLMQAVVREIQQLMPNQVQNETWEMAMLGRLVSLCCSCASRWIQLDRLFPSAASVLAVQAFMQGCAYNAYFGTCSAAGLASGEKSGANLRVEVEELSMAEDISALENATRSDLRLSVRDWATVDTTTSEPMPECRQYELSAMASGEMGFVPGRTILEALEHAVDDLHRMLEELGVF